MTSGISFHRDIIFMNFDSKMFVFEHPVANCCYEDKLAHFGKVVLSFGLGGAHVIVAGDFLVLL